MTPYNPNKRFVCKLSKKFMDETKSGLIRVTAFNPEEWVTCFAEVVSIPTLNTLDVQVGDILYFSYQVLMDIIQRENETPIFNNMIFVGKEEYCLVEGALCYFRVRGEQIKMLNGYVLLNVIHEQAPKSTLVVPEYLKTKVAKNKAKVLCIDEPNEFEPELDLKEGDVIFHNPLYTEHYPLSLGGEDEKDYFITEQCRILAKE